MLAVAGLGLTPLAGSPARASIWAFVWFKVSMGTIAPSAKSLSPLCVIFRHLASSWFTARNSKRSMMEPGKRVVSPNVSTRTFRSICETMISMCLSLISTRWLR